MNFHDIEQNTDEWMELRGGKVTSSAFSQAMAHFGKGFGEPAKKYAQNIAIERVSGKKLELDSFYNKNMARGHEFEPVACELYEIDHMVSVKNGGFFEDGKCGDSPDGLVGNDGVVEIKCVIPATHYKRLEKGGYGTAYQWQIHWHIWKTDRKWCDFVQYCPEFPEDKQLYIFRVHRDEKIIMKMKIRLAQFEELIEQNIKFLTK